jgi:hypothetical protein
MTSANLEKPGARRSKANAQAAIRVFEWRLLPRRSAASIGANNFGLIRVPLLVFPAIAVFVFLLYLMTPLTRAPIVAPTIALVVFVALVILLASLARIIVLLRPTFIGVGCVRATLVATQNGPRPRNPLLGLSEAPLQIALGHGFSPVPTPHTTVLR